MMKLGQMFFFSLLVLMLTSCKSDAEKMAERNAVIDSTIVGFQKKLLGMQLDSIFSQNQFNASVSIVQNGKKIYEKENGYEDFQTKSKLDSTSVFAIASISKQFTAVLILLQQEQGKLNVNELVSKYLTDFQKPNFDKVTIHQLLNHTSGLNDFGENLQFESGSDYSYSNKGYLYLGEIIAQVSGKSYDQNAKDLFQKAGMNHTSTAGIFQGKDLAYANTGTLDSAQKVENMPKRLTEKTISTPAGGILSTVNDLHKWNEALYNDKILKPETLNLFEKNYVTREHYVLGNVGYGYGIMMNEATPEAYFHTGYVKGAPSLLMYYPETKTSVVILSNFANESKGKESIFVPHRRIKDITDAVENTVAVLRKEMIK